MGNRGTKAGALFTPVDDEIRQAVLAVCQPSISRYCRDIGISFDTVYGLIRGHSKWVSDDVLKRVGVFQQFADREWKTKMAWPIGKKLPGRTMPIRQGRNGLEKTCNCPKHNGAWVSLGNFNFHKTGGRKGKPFSQCKDGDHRARLRNWTGQHGFIPVARVRFAWIELVRRLGVSEASRRCNVKANFNKNIEKQTVVRKSTANRIFNALASVRANNEVRHKDSIRRGAAMRGETERVPIRSLDFNSPQGDELNERRRQYDRDHPEIAKKAEARHRERRRERRAASL